MKSILVQEFEVLRIAMLDAATAIDAGKPREAEKHLRIMRSACEVILDLLEDLPDSPLERKLA